MFIKLKKRINSNRKNPSSHGGNYQMIDAKRFLHVRRDVKRFELFLSFQADESVTFVDPEMIIGYHTRESSWPLPLIRTCTRLQDNQSGNSPLAGCLSQRLWKWPSPVITGRFAAYEKFINDSPLGRTQGKRCVSRKSENGILQNKKRKRRKWTKAVGAARLSVTRRLTSRVDGSPCRSAGFSVVPLFY